MSLTLRLSLTYMLVTLGGVLLLGLGLVALAERYLADERQGELAAQAAIYGALLGELADDEAALQAIVAGGAAPLPAGVAARLFSSAGALIAGDPALGPFPSRPALALARPPFPLPASQVAGRRYAASAVPGPAGSIGVVELSRPADEDTSLLAALRQIALQAALVAAGAMALLSLALARSIARPVLRVARRAEALAASVGAGPGADARPQALASMSGPTPAAPRDEIARLAGSLEQLERGLSAYVERIGELEQARARFYRSVSHELRTPLTAIRATAENLADTASPAQRPALERLEAEAARLSRLVDELLRPPPDGRLLLAERRRLDLAALAAELVGLLDGRARRAGVTLRALSAGPVLVLGDRDRLKQALLNLIDNALRASPPGGTVRLRVVGAGDRALASVEDEGPGVPAPLRDQIWQRGVRGQVAGSAGLGLAIVREIVAAHGGRATIHPAYSSGARFVIELPLAPQAAPSGAGR